MIVTGNLRSSPTTAQAAMCAPAELLTPGLPRPQNEFASPIRYGTFEVEDASRRAVAEVPRH
jgi:hypothetical protein